MSFPNAAAATGNYRLIARMDTDGSVRLHVEWRLTALTKADETDGERWVKVFEADTAEAADEYVRARQEEWNLMVGGRWWKS